MATSLEVKLASFIVHLAEAYSGEGNEVDIAVAKDLLNDPEVAEMLTPGPLIPVSRSGHSVHQMFASWYDHIDYN